jgi:hypothetical protein
MASSDRVGQAVCRLARLAGGVALLAGTVAMTVGVVDGQGGEVTVRGCVERDAASRAALYKLVEDPGTRVFRLTAPKDIDVATQVGHTVDVTGALTTSGPQTRDPELLVKKLELVRPSCANPGAR